MPETMRPEGISALVGKGDRIIYNHWIAYNARVLPGL